MTDNDIDADIYYKTLCSSGLSFVNKQHSQIEQKRINLIENKQKLVYSNYDSIIKFSNFSKELINDVRNYFSNSIKQLFFLISFKILKIICQILRRQFLNLKKNVKYFPITLKRFLAGKMKSTLKICIYIFVLDGKMFR